MDAPIFGLDQPRPHAHFAPLRAPWAPRLSASAQHPNQEPIMAKSNTVQIKLISTADTGFFYVTKKNARTTTTKLELKKYDPVVRKHVAFKESKIK
jgi:large subunit ribosomal protein L33